MNGNAKILRVEEIEQLYPDEWILLEITRDAIEHHRIAGRVLAHSHDRAEFREPYQRFRAKHPYARLFQFFTGDIVPEGVVVIL